MSGWVVVADSLFLPAVVGGHREHAGFVDAAARAGLVAAIVVPRRPREVVPATMHGVPVVGVVRDLRLRRLLDPRAPFVVTSRPARAGLVEAVAAVAPDATGVVVFSYKAHRIGRRLAEALGVPAVLRSHNLEAHYHRELARATHGPRRWILRLEAARIARDERRMEGAGWLSGIADISATDARVRSRRSPVPVAHVPPFAFAGADVAAPTSRATDEVLFLGALDVPTNLAGLGWFVEHVWPLVRHRVTARLVVVGSRPPRALVRRLDAVDGVELHADVPDTAPYLGRATVAVNPTVSGSGVNIKLVEYLLAGVPTVTTAAAAEGLGLPEGPGLAVADTPEAFADAVVSALHSPASTGPAIRDLLEPERGLARVRELLEAG